MFQVERSMRFPRCARNTLPTSIAMYSRRPRRPGKMTTSCNTRTTPSSSMPTASVSAFSIPRTRSRSVPTRCARVFPSTTRLLPPLRASNRSERPKQQPRIRCCDSRMLNEPRERKTPMHASTRSRLQTLSNFADVGSLARRMGVRYG
ncbi:MAG: hypothetical protein MHM6MM_005059, partial [Cercozoa sp. M6MM]